MDWNHHATLLHIADKANQWPQLHWLRDKAIEELQNLKEAASEATKKAEAKVAEIEEVAKTDFNRLRENLRTPATKPEVE